VGRELHQVTEWVDGVDYDDDDDDDDDDMADSGKGRFRQHSAGRRNVEVRQRYDGWYRMTRHSRESAERWRHRTVRGKSRRSPGHAPGWSLWQHNRPVCTVDLSAGRMVCTSEQSVIPIHSTI